MSALQGGALEWCIGEYSGVSRVNTIVFVGTFLNVDSMESWGNPSEAPPNVRTEFLNWVINLLVFLLLYVFVV